MEQETENAGANALVKNIMKETDAFTAKAQQDLHCGTPQAMDGCDVKVRYLYSAVRSFSPAQVFSQLVVGFKLAQQDSRVVGINIVAPENDYVTLRDYSLQMKMLQFLHKKYPKVKMSLHAGELSLGGVAPRFMLDHIDQAINVAGASRIGHGVDIAYETNSIYLLREMAHKHIAIEQCLTSNEELLGIEGAEHPLPLYLQYHVPVTLSTDDEGVLRTQLTTEYWKAVMRYNLSYPQIKNIARNAIAYSFLPGQNLWGNLDKYTSVTECQGNVLGAQHPTASCQKFLSHSEKAQAQWKLEWKFQEFERSITQQMKS
jgi:adenosine deaminase